eukprot:CAMPEP_0119049238 /NCGR_PEP_ID=MMETSP1177-20130426/63584_1 /TAXON_ID=2985 /ORGANISM="Ochromonas sp, Strain CCMP1899" /LENGTH=236 /DNA_ID=CAMNT_0007026209 /DNA_START=178 /DNA_END=888 /DNA_ORIENTATION=-
MTVTVNRDLNQYISVFTYGACVFFNIPTAEHLQHLRRIKEAAIVSPIAEDRHFVEDYKVIVNEHLDKPSVVRSEHLNIRCLDSKNLTIIATLMAQTVALEYYSTAVQSMMEEFTKINMKIEETGNFDSMDKISLYKMVASNNIIIINVLSKLGIFEGSDAAWDNADYNKTWEALRKDFEIENSFKDISLKLDIVKNARFFLEMAHNQKSTKLEWYIIILIAVEILIAIEGKITHVL